MTERYEKDLARLLNLPWTVLREETPDGEIILRVKEIPSAVGSGATDQERVDDLWESLRESLRAYLHFGDPIPLPQGAAATWPHLATDAQQIPGVHIMGMLGARTGAAGTRS